MCICDFKIKMKAKLIVILLVVSGLATASPTDDSWPRLDSIIEKNKSDFIRSEDSSCSRVSIQEKKKKILFELEELLKVDPEIAKELNVCLLQSLANQRESDNLRPPAKSALKATSRAYKSSSQGLSNLEEDVSNRGNAIHRFSSIDTINSALLARDQPVKHLFMLKNRSNSKKTRLKQKKEKEEEKERLSENIKLGMTLIKPVLSRVASKYHPRAGEILNIIIPDESFVSSPSLARDKPDLRIIKLGPVVENLSTMGLNTVFDKLVDTVLSQSALKNMIAKHSLQFVSSHLIQYLTDYLNRRVQCE